MTLSKANLLLYVIYYVALKLGQFFGHNYFPLVILSSLRKIDSFMGEVNRVSLSY